ncbi:response regulator transcription factor [Paenibacillus eucommiae]|uniref:DNA-binding response OmpR family regulator n=1 Tax=Paenibacillus eucommiae TaxID=1355755 RepID=A0ABS4J5F1_9BACL|nr:response regulator transcription factor [Paenibacillus eucommiae]MBP1995058.1 DNA-binding response OmpR family regulator [Paenibacillus eucommiae]
MPLNILVVEDDTDINRLLGTLLGKQGYQTESAFSGSEAKLLLSMREYDLVLLDLMLPGMPGEELMKDIRSHSYVPVIIISAKAETKDKIELLKYGADDYITKPFDKDEVLARVEAQLRRYKTFSLTEQTAKQLIYQDLVLDITSRTVTLAGNPVSLTSKEFELLTILVRSPGKLFTREDLYQAVWHEKYVIEDNTINVHMSNLRSKLSKNTPDRIYIETVWGIGFKMV